MNLVVFWSQMYSSYVLFILSRRSQLHIDEKEEEKEEEKRERGAKSKHNTTNKTAGREKEKGTGRPFIVGRIFSATFSEVSCPDGDLRLFGTRPRFRDGKPLKGRNISLPSSISSFPRQARQHSSMSSSSTAHPRCDGRETGPSPTLCYDAHSDMASPSMFSLVFQLAHVSDYHHLTHTNRKEVDQNLTSFY